MFSIIEVPFHLGLEEVAVGKGPASLLRAGADQLLAERGMPPQVTHVRPRDLRSKGMEILMDVCRMTRYAVKDAAGEDTIPLVFAGNCHSCVGTLAGLDTSRLGIVWFDKHPDFLTPETTTSGSIEGMALSIATGHCHQGMCEFVGLDSPIPEQNVILVGAGDVEPAERQRLEQSWISVHPFDSLGLLPVALDQLRGRIDGVYFHIDTDFLDVIENGSELVALVEASVPLAAVGVTNYNPDLDEDRMRERAILDVISALKPRVQ